MLNVMYINFIFIILYTSNFVYASDTTCTRIDNRNICFYRSDDGQQILHGESITYDVANRIVSLYHYKHGLRQGIAINWQPTGGKLDSTNCLEDRKHGVYKSWFKNGVLSEYKKFKKGINYDTSYVWYENGKIHDFEVYDTSYNVRKWIEGGPPLKRKIFWHENGQKKGDYKFLRGIIASKKTWYSNGKKKIEAEYDNGLELTVKIWDYTGKLITNRKGQK